ncbi:MAG TPA: cytochrome c3 family protein [Candidatus Methanoperedens sp.]
MTISSTYEDWSKSIHFLYGVTCDKCHGGNASAVTKEETHTDFTNGTFSNGSIARANTPEICGKCHSLQLAEFKMSKHYHILTSAGEKRNAPACITCHQAHSIHVLAASEIVNFCGNCHNNKTGINPSVPKRAEAALNSVYELRVEISKAQSDIRSANASGRDVIEAQEEVNTAKTILKDTASVWHRFNLTYFETDVQQGLDDAKNAQNITAEIPAITMPAKAPGFEGILFIFGLVIAYFMFSKRNSR